MSAFVGAYFRSISAALVSFLGGVLIDLDHLLDYYANNGFTLRFRDIYNGCCDAVGLRKIYILLHSYELLVIFWAIIAITTPGKLWLAFAIGLTQHILVDTITNGLAPFGYMLTYRAKKGFQKGFILPASKPLGGSCEVERGESTRQEVLTAVNKS